MQEAPASITLGSVAQVVGSRERGHRAKGTNVQGVRIMSTKRQHSPTEKVSINGKMVPAWRKLGPRPDRFLTRHQRHPAKGGGTYLLRPESRKATALIYHEYHRQQGQG